MNIAFSIIQLNEYQVLDPVLSHSDNSSPLFHHTEPSSYRFCISKSRVMNLKGISPIRFSYRIKSIYPLKRVVAGSHTYGKSHSKGNVYFFLPEVILLR